MITTARLVLEPVRGDHAAVMFEGLQDERAYRFIPNDPPECVASLAARYRMWAPGLSPDGREIWLNWMARHENVFVGHFQATVIPTERAALVAYHVFPAFWGQNFGREAVAGLLADIGPRHGLSEARAFIDTRNAASIKLVESLGFVLQDTIAGADMFRGEPSDEYLYILRFPPHAHPFPRHA